MRSFVNHAARWSWLQSLNSVALLGFWLLTFLEHTPHNMSNKIDRRKSNGAVWKERETLKSCNLKTSLCKNEKIGNIRKSDFSDHDLPINFHFNRKSVGSIYRCYRYWTWENSRIEIKQWGREKRLLENQDLLIVCWSSHWNKVHDLILKESCGRDPCGCYVNGKFTSQGQLEAIAGNDLWFVIKTSLTAIFSLFEVIISEWPLK